MSLCWARAPPALQQPQVWLCPPLASPVPHLDLGKKMSIPQDLMIEELSLHDNRGSQLFQQRQRRMQRFIFEHPRGYKQVGLWHSPASPSRTALPWLSEPMQGSHSWHSFRSLGTVVTFSCSSWQDEGTGEIVWWAGHRDGASISFSND